MASLRFIAGAAARRKIEAAGGLTPDLVRLVLAASGGPKWLVLKALDHRIFGDWLPKAPQQVDLIGSSIGAWRMAGAAHPHAAHKIPEFHEGYFSYRYQKGEGPAVITRNTEDLLDRWLSDEDCRAVVHNSKRPLHIMVTRSKGLLASKNPIFEGLGLGLAGISSAFHRRAIGMFFDRCVLSSNGVVPQSDIWADYGRRDYVLEAGALKDAIMASCSIPFLVDPVTKMAGLPPGRYRDGGFIDYHFDVPFAPADGIVLYPHFYPYLVPGWFDKRFTARRAGARTLDHMLVLAPSGAHVAALPRGQIPDRNDFYRLDNDARLAEWRKVVSLSEKLADDFQRAVENPDWLMSVLEPAPAFSAQ